MAVLDHQEQESVDAIKAWWKQYGKLVIALIVLIIGAAGGFEAWRYYQDSQASKASQLYSELQQAATSNDKEKVMGHAKELQEKYHSAGYAVMAGLTAARLSFVSGDMANAKSQLQWVIDHALDPESKDLATLRLARLHFGEKDYSGVMKLLDSQRNESFTSLYLDLKGDVFLAQGKIAEAQMAYQAALDKLGKESNYRSVIRIKLDSLGVAK